ncbi:MAG: NAD(P)/FAD-dependent oxidoreductase [Ornithinimicrobium sp.]|uniref:NAD(P)/FAD-dependent oxidoreductase n=1 Tax=Ornithinimicrobium sp. TaxID=1977084 RepID=UPI003D9BF9C7
MRHERPGCRLLLVGAGHAHLHLVVRARELVDAGYAVQLLAPPTFSYSGVASACATGALPADAGTVDVAALAAGHPVTHHIGELAQLDLPGRRARTSDGAWLHWDVLSLNIGSVASAESLEVDPEVLRIKPLESLGDLRLRVADRRHQMGDHTGDVDAEVAAARVTLVGGGPSGLELAGNLSAQGRTRVTILEAGATLDPQLPARARRRARRMLRSRGVRVHTGTRVVRLGQRDVTLADDRTLAHDVAVLATGLVSPPLGQRIGLGGPDGIPVRATLQHRDHDDVYAVGDCADFLPRPLARIGVHGVRQGPVLLGSLLARAAGEALPEYVPQRHALQILDLGGGLGLAVRGRWWWQGRLALHLKRWIDRRWLRTYQRA